MTDTLVDTWIAREICNGMWTVSSVALMAVLAAHLFKCFRLRGRKCLNDLGIQFALALLLLVSGHFGRSLFSWFEFVYLVNGQSPGLFARTEPFIVGTGLILLGKGVCVAVLTVPPWRWTILAVTAFLTATIPILVLLWF